MGSVGGSWSPKHLPGKWQFWVQSARLAGGGTLTFEEKKSVFFALGITIPRLRQEGFSACDDSALQNGRQIFLK